MLKVISGAQTGADLAGLRAAKACGLKTGGFAARGFENENGKFPEYEQTYGLVDKGYNYARRTIENIKMSNVTFIFSDELNSPGTKLTIKTCESLNKPYVLNPNAAIVQNWVELKWATPLNKWIDTDEHTREDDVYVINIAGNRESVSPGITLRVEKLLTEAFRRCNYG